MSDVDMDDPPRAEDENMEDEKEPLPPPDDAEPNSPPPEDADTGSQSEEGIDENADGEVRCQLPGTIQFLELQNFMCHKKFFIEFGPRLNVITGANGAGKSAIAHGILLATAANIKGAGRGNQSKSIRDGENWSKIRLTFNNVGETALEGWGETITVLRTLTRGKNGKGGSSQFSIEGASGMKQKGKRAVEALMDQLEIKPNNPCVILTQSEAKALFGNSTPEKRMELLANATDLKQTEVLLEVERETLEKTEGNMKDGLDRLKIAKDKYKKKRKQLTKLQELQANNYAAVPRDAKTFLQVDLWTKRWKDTMQKRKKLTRTKDKIVNKVKEFTEAKEKAKEFIAGVKDKVKKHKETVGPLKKALTKAKDDRSEAKAAHKEAAKDASRKSKIKSSLEKEMKDFKKRKAQLEKELTKDLGEDSSKLREALEKASDIKANLDKQKAEAEKKLHDLPVEQGLDEDIRHSDNEVRQKQKEVQSAEFSLKRARESLKKGDNVQRFCKGFSYRNVMQEVRNTRFDGKVIGPLGMHVKLKTNLNKEQKDYIVNVEHALGNVLQGWAVTSLEDSRKLQKILKKHTSTGRIPPVYVQSCSKRYTDQRVVQNMLNSEVANRVYRAYDFVEIQDNWAHNVFVDQTGLESMFFCREKAQAQDLVEKYSREIKCVYIRQGSRLSPGRGGGIVADTMKIQNRTPHLLVHDFTKWVGHYEYKVKQLKEEYRAAGSKLDDLRRQKKKAAKLRKSAEQAFRDIQRKVREADDKVSDLSERVSADKQSAGQNLQEAMQDFQREEQGWKEKLEKIEKAVKAADDKAVEADQKLKDASGRYKNIRKQIDDLEETLQDEKDKAETNKKRIEKCDTNLEKLGKFNRDYAGKDEKFKEDIANADKHLVTAKNLEANVKHSRKECVKWMGRGNKLSNEEREDLIKQLEDKIAALESDRKATIDRLGNPTQVHNEVIQLREARDKIQKDQENLNQALEIAQKAVTDRLKMFKKKRKQVLKAVQRSFRKLMQKQGHQGNLQFSNDCKQLKMKLKLSNHDKATTDVRTLSGGEKSWSQLCFLLSVSHLVDGPISILDEFDVFMDGVTREASVNALVEFCKDKDRQFIFITPNDARPFKDKLGDKVTIKVIEKKND